MRLYMCLSVHSTRYTHKQVKEKINACHKKDRPSPVAINLDSLMRISRGSTSFTRFAKNTHSLEYLQGQRLLHPLCNLGYSF